MRGDMLMCPHDSRHGADRILRAIEGIGSGGRDDIAGV